jgi:hypothetical protein
MSFSKILLHIGSVLVFFLSAFIAIGFLIIETGDTRLVGVSISGLITVVSGIVGWKLDQDFLKRLDP